MINLDEACAEIMRLVRDMADNADIEQLVAQKLASAYESGFIDGQNEASQEF